MKLNLKELVNKPEKGTSTIEIKERLPFHIEHPCTVQVTYSVESIDDFYLIHLNTEASLRITCLRCMQAGVIPYQNTSAIAVCSNDARAEQLLADYECLVSPSFLIDLTETLTDELHLYSPQFHLDYRECGVDFG